MPIEYRFEKDDTQSDKKRKLDYISGMMDTYAIEMYIKHFGTDPFLRNMMQLYSRKELVKS